MDTGLLRTVSRTSRCRRPAARGARPERGRATRRRWARSTRHSSPGSTRAGTWPRPTAARRSPTLRKNPKTTKLRAVRAGHFAIVDADLLDSGADDRRRPARARPPAASGCVSLSSTPSRSTATGRCSSLTDPVPALRARARRARDRAVRRRRSPRRSGPRSRTTGRAPTRVATRRASRRCGATASASSSHALGDPLEPDAFVDDFIGALVFEPIAGRGRDARAASRPRGSGSPSSRTGTARSRSTSSSRAARPLRHGRDVGARRRRQARPGDLRARARELGVDAGSRACTSATSRSTRRAPAPPASRFLPAPLATAFDGLDVSGQPRRLARARRAPRSCSATRRAPRGQARPERRLPLEHVDRVRRLLRDLPRRSCSLISRERHARAAGAAAAALVGQGARASRPS